MVHLISPQNNESFEAGDNITVLIGKMNKGDLYEINLEKPAKVTGEIVLKEEIEANSSGKDWYEIELPSSLEEGSYYLSVIQRTSEGVECVNYACAQESVVIQIEG